MLVFLNGQIIKEEDAKVSIDDLSYQFGYGLFETIRFEKGIPVFFELHYKRLDHSAREIGMPFPVDLDKLRKWIIDVVKANKLENARVKLIVSKRVNNKFNVLILVEEIKRSPESYSIVQSPIIRDQHSISFKHKTTSRADSYVAYKYAIENGFNDALYLNSKNEITECTRANVFLVMEDKIITPVLESAILSGVTRTKVLEIAKKEDILVEEKSVHSLYLTRAKDVFITNAIIGIMPVSRLKLIEKEYLFSRDVKTIRLKNLYDVEIQEYLKKSSNLIKA